MSAKRCEFGQQEETMLRDKVVFGIRDMAIKERLLREPELTLKKALDICRAAEASRQQVRAMASAPHTQSATDVNLLRKPRTGSGREMKKHFISSCRFCGRSHERGNCPAYGKTCTTCNGRNHDSSVCEGGGFRRNNHTGNAARKKFKPRPHKRHSHKNVNAIDEETSNVNINAVTGAETLFIGSLHTSSSDKWQEPLVIGNSTVVFKLDTGADANVIPRRIVAKIGELHRIEPTNQPLRAFGGSKVMPLGTVDIVTKCPRTNISLTTKYYVTDTADIPIFGKHACEQFGLVQRIFSVSSNNLTVQSLTDTYSDVFTGLGKYAVPYKIAVNPQVQPVIQRCRKVPLSKLPALKLALEDLEQSGVIAPVDKPTDWVHNLVITEKKNGSLRICLDPKPLNLAIKRETHNIPTADDVQAQLCGKSVFTVVDMKDSYWQICLDDESSYLCTFHTPWGRKRFCRMPFGISSASEVMQKRNEATFGDIQGVFVIADDLIIAAKDEAEHDAILHKVMQRAREKNVRFNKNKLQLKLSEVSYMGNVVTAAGLPVARAYLRRTKPAR
jgi:hypothetical protein